MILRIMFALTLVCAVPAFAQSGKEHGFALDFGIGIPNGSLQNPDDSYAYYNGLMLQGRAIVPIISQGLFATSFTTSIRYLDYKNTANDSGQKEFASHLGPGAGLRISFAKLYVGAEYYYIFARHYGVGAFSNELQFNYNPFSYYGGIGIPFGSLSVGLSYTVSSATISSKETGLSKSSKYSDKLIMLNVIWDTGASFADFTSKLFK